MEQNSKPTPWYVLNCPEAGGTLRDFYTACNQKGVLNKKTKELLMLSLACAFRCRHCTEEHIQKALEAGVSREEITEALLITAMEGAGTQLAWAKEIFIKYLGTVKQ
ncbi:MAG: carboxymuconolactone decarboxylase family protein [Phycisphaerae bacterium]|jgi:AhpD family alkylhydroperoxidase